MSFESHWSAYLRIDISNYSTVYEWGTHFERNCFKMQNLTTYTSTCTNNELLQKHIKCYYNFIRYIPELWLICQLLVHSLIWNKSSIPCASQKWNLKTCGGGQPCLDRRGSQFYNFREQIFKRQFLQQKFTEIYQIFTMLWHCVQICALRE